MHMGSHDSVPRGLQKIEKETLRDAERWSTRKSVATVRTACHLPARVFRHSVPPRRTEQELLFQETFDPVQDGGIHRRRYPAGLRVLLARVVHPEQLRKVGGHFSFCAVREFVEGSRRDHSALLQDFEIGVPSDSPKCQNRLWFQDLKFAFKVTAAIRDFSRQRFIVWWRAPACRADVRV